MADNYNIDPTILGNYRLPQVTMPFQHMQDVLTLADLMDKRKMTQRTMKEAAQKDAINAELSKGFADQLGQYNAPSAYQPPEEVAPATPAEMEQYKIPQPPQEQPIVPFAQDYIKPTAPAYEGPLATPEQLPEIAKGINQQAQEQYQANVAGEPQERIPEAYSFLAPDQYKNFLTASSHNPDLGMDYLTKIISQKKTLAEAKKLNDTNGYGNTDLGLNLKYSQDPEFVQNTLEGIQRLVESGALPQDLGEQFTALAKVKPLTARDKLTEYLSSIRKPGQVEELTRPGKIETAKAVEEATAPIKVKTAAATEYAKTQAGTQAAIDFVVKNGLKGVDPATGKPYTSTQSSAAGFALQMNQANDVIDSLANQGFDEGSLDNAIMSQIGQNTTVADISFNAFKDPTMKMYAQAKFAWCMAYLRKTSGAAINKDEYQSATKIYFGQYKDPPEALNQKRNFRLNQTGAIMGEAGNAYSEFTNSISDLIKEKEPANPYKDAVIKPKASLPKLSASEAKKLKAGTHFLGLDGKEYVR